MGCTQSRKVDKLRSTVIQAAGLDRHFVIGPGTRAYYFVRASINSYEPEI